jgi:hypothetical protein
MTTRRHLATTPAHRAAQLWRWAESQHNAPVHAAQPSAHPAMGVLLRILVLLFRRSCCTSSQTAPGGLQAHLNLTPSLRQHVLRCCDGRRRLEKPFMMRLPIVARLHHATSEQSGCCAVVIQLSTRWQHPASGCNVASRPPAVLTVLPSRLLAEHAVQAMVAEQATLRDLASRLGHRSRLAQAVISAQVTPAIARMTPERAAAAPAVYRLRRPRWDAQGVAPLQAIAAAAKRKDSDAAPDVVNRLRCTGYPPHLAHQDRTRSASPSCRYACRTKIWRRARACFSTAGSASIKARAS